MAAYQTCFICGSAVERACTDVRYMTPLAVPLYLKRVRAWFLKTWMYESAPSIGSGLILEIDLCLRCLDKVEKGDEPRLKIFNNLDELSDLLAGLKTSKRSCESGSPSVPGGNEQPGPCELPCPADDRRRSYAYFCDCGWVGEEGDRAWLDSLAPRKCDRCGGECQLLSVWSSTPRNDDGQV